MRISRHAQQAEQVHHWMQWCVVSLERQPLLETFRDLSWEA